MVLDFIKETAWFLILILILFLVVLWIDCKGNCIDETKIFNTIDNVASDDMKTLHQKIYDKGFQDGFNQGYSQGHMTGTIISTIAK